MTLNGALRTVLRFLEAAVSKNPWADRRDRNLAKAFARAERALNRHWAKQQAAVIKALRLASIREAEEPPRVIPPDVLALIQGAVSGVPLSPSDASLFDRQIVTAIRQGQMDAAASLNSSRPIALEPFEVRYLRTAGFSKLSGNLDQTSVKQLADAVAKAYANGADYEKVVATVKDQFRQFSRVRAEMIAQTELNAAYNKGIMQMGLDTGAAGKSWELWASDACPVCVGNNLQGVILLTDNFQSGDDSAPAHPRCRCSLVLHANEL